MEIIERQVNQITVIDLKGMATISGSFVRLQQIVDERLQAGHKQFVINLAECTWMDSSGLGELVRVLVRIIREGGKLKLAEVPGKVRGLLEITNLTQIFEDFDDEQSALDSF